MIQKVNAKYKDLFSQPARYFICMGGRSGGRATGVSAGAENAGPAEAGAHKPAGAARKNQ